MGLGDYKNKRNFSKTPEPPGSEGDGLRYVIHLHRATRLHFDLRLEVDGILKSWAVPKGPSLNPTEQRLAVRVEDHPMEYGEFEGVIPEGNYGAGAVVLWDEGIFVERSSRGREDSLEALRGGLEKGRVTVVFFGRRLRGEFALIRSEKDPKHWLLLKKRDEFAQYKPEPWEPRSVRTGRTLDEVAAQAPVQGAYWGKASTPSRPLPQPGKEQLGMDTRPKENLPRRFKPMLPLAQTTVPNSKEWVALPVFDGYRVLAEVDPRGARLYSKAGRDFSARFPTLIKALGDLGQTLLLDGEVVVLDEQGVPDPKLLRGYQKDRVGTPKLFVWDALHQGGVTLRSLPLASRLTVVRDLLKGATELQVPDGEDAPFSLWRHRGTRYESGTSSFWMKVPRESAAGAAPSTETPSGQRPRLTHLDRILWPEEGYTKRDLVEYYESVSEVLLPHLKDRPQSLHRHPHGIASEGFFQKDISQYVPRWVSTVPVTSGTSGRTINYLLVQNVGTLLFLANYGCIELNPWFSRLPRLDQPDFLVIDLDPDGNPFDEVVQVALSVRAVLDEVGAQSWCKTSGATGLHICVPTVVTFEEALQFSVRITEAVARRHPDITSTERSPSRRRGKIYLDAFQNRRGQTLASVYCLRPRPGAPASTPLHWDEVRPGLDPSRFTIQTLPKRIVREGDLWKPMLTTSVHLARCLENLPE